MNELYKRDNDWLPDQVIAYRIGKILKKCYLIREDNGKIVARNTKHNTLTEDMVFREVYKKVHSFRTNFEKSIGRRYPLTKIKDLKNMYIAGWRAQKSHPKAESDFIMRKTKKELDSMYEQGQCGTIFLVRQGFDRFGAKGIDDNDERRVNNRLTLGDMEKEILKEIRKFNSSFVFKFRKLIFTLNGREIVKWEEVDVNSRVVVRPAAIRVRWRGTPKMDISQSTESKSFPLSTYDNFRNRIGAYWKVEMKYRPSIVLQYDSYKLSRQTFEHLRDGDEVEALPSRSTPVSGVEERFIDAQPAADAVLQGSVYDNEHLTPTEKLQVAFMELIDNAISAMVASNLEKPKLDIRVHKHQIDQRTAHSISFVNEGEGMDTKGLQNYLKLRQNKATNGNKDKDGANTRGFCYVDGRLNLFGEGAKDAIFLVARAGFITSRMRHNPTVATAACSKDYIHYIKKRDPKWHHKYPVYDRECGNPKVGERIISDPCYKEFYQSKLFKDLVSNERKHKEFTRIILYDINQDLVKYLEGEHITHLRRKLAHTYHLYLHPHHIPFFMKNNPVDSDRERLPMNCFYDTQEKRFRDLSIRIEEYHDEDVEMDVEVEDVPSSSNSLPRRVRGTGPDKYDGPDLQRISTLPVLYFKKKKISQSFQLNLTENKSCIGVSYYFPFENGKETNPDYIEGYKVSRGEEIIGIFERQTEDQIGNPEKFVHLDDKSKILSKRSDGQGWVCMQDNTELFDSVSTAGTPDAVKDWNLRGSFEAMQDSTKLKVEEFKGTRSPPIETYWQGRRLIDGNYNDDKECKNFHHSNRIRPELRWRRKIQLFFGESFRPSRSKLRLQPLSTKKSIPNFIGDATGRILRGQHLAASSSGTRNFQKQLRNFLETQGPKHDLQVILRPFKGSQPSPPERGTATHRFDSVELMTNGATKSFKVGDIVQTSSGRQHMEICYFEAKSIHMARNSENKNAYALKNRGFVASSALMTGKLLPIPERKGYRAKLKTMSIFKISKTSEKEIKSVSDLLKGQWPCKLKFNDLETKKPYKNFIFNHINPFPWPNSDEIVPGFDDSSTTEVQAGKPIFAYISPVVVTHGCGSKKGRKKETKQYTVIMRLYKEGENGNFSRVQRVKDFKFHRRNKPNWKFKSPGRYVVQFLVDMDSNVPWHPLIYQVCLKAVPGPPYKICISSDGPSLRLQEEYESKVDFEVHDKFGNLIEDFPVDGYEVCIDDNKALKLLNPVVNKEREDGKFSLSFKSIQPVEKNASDYLSPNPKKVPELLISHKKLTVDASGKCKLVVKPGFPYKVCIDNSNEIKKIDAKNCASLTVGSGRFLDKDGYETDLPSIDIRISIEIQTVDEETKNKVWKKVWEGTADKKGDFFKIDTLDEKIELPHTNFGNYKAPLKQVRIRARVENYGIVANGFIKPHGKPDYIIICAPNYVPVGERFQATAKIYTDGNTVAQPSRKNKADKLSVTVVREEQIVASQFVWTGDIEAPKKIPEDHPDYIEIKVQFLGLSETHHVEMKKGEPFKWISECDDKFVWSSGCNIQERLTLVDIYDNPLSAPPKKKENTFQLLNASNTSVKSGSTSRERRGLVGITKMDTKGLPVGEYMLKVWVPGRTKSSATQFGVQIRHGLPHHWKPISPDLQRTIDLRGHLQQQTILTLNAQLEDKAGNVCVSLNNVRASLKLQPCHRRGIPEAISHGQISAKVWTSDLVECCDGYLNFKTVRFNIKVLAPETSPPTPPPSPPRPPTLLPPPPSPTLHWVDKSPLRKTKINAKTRLICKESGYCGVLNDYVVLRHSSGHQESPELHKMLSVRLSRVLNLVVVNGYDSEAGRWLKQNHIPMWDFSSCKNGPIPETASSIPRCVCDYLHVIENDHGGFPTAGQIKRFLYYFCGGKAIVAGTLTDAQNLRRNWRNSRKQIPTIWTYSPIDEIKGGGVHSNLDWSHKNKTNHEDLHTILQLQCQEPDSKQNNSGLGRDNAITSSNSRVRRTRSHGSESLPSSSQSKRHRGTTTRR